MCLALLLGARRMIELTDGRTGLGALQFGEQTAFSRAIVGRVSLVLLGLTLLSEIAALVLHLPFEHLPFKTISPIGAFNGIAFDQFHDIGRLWTAIISAFVILLVIEKGEGRTPNLSGLASQFARHWLYILAATTFIFGFATIRMWVVLAIFCVFLRRSHSDGA